LTASVFSERYLIPEVTADPLERANEALDEIRSGRLVSAAVLRIV
jgi:hypothetical protein